MGSIEDRGPQITGVGAAFCVLASVAVGLRFFVRIRLLHAFGTDDWFMAVALVSFIINTACTLAGAHYGSGRHYWDLTPEGISMALKFWYFCYLSFATTMIAAKVSVALLLLRITPSRLHSWIIYIATGLTVATGIAFFFICLFQCQPVQFFWNRTLPGGKCFDTKVIIIIAYTYSIASMITDFTLSILPMFMVWQLNMGLNIKLALVPIVSMACLASSAVGVRLVYLPNFGLDDFLWATADIAIWSEVEQGLAITAASFATLRPLFRVVFSNFGILSTGSDTAPSGAANGNKNPIGSTGWSKTSRRSKRSSHHSSISLSTLDQRDQK